MIRTRKNLIFNIRDKNRGYPQSHFIKSYDTAYNQKFKYLCETQKTVNKIWT